MVKKNRKIRKQQQTLVFVGEGETEKAFLQHLKSIFCDGTLKITLKSAGGKGPSNVINGAIGTLENSGCDKVAVLLDTDIKWPVNLVKTAKQKNITLIGSEPCIEGLLLSILGQPHPTPSNNDSCKAKMHPQLDGKATAKESYQKLFTKDVLINAAVKNKPLREIIQIMTNKTFS